jgi:hypothetical protein
MARTAADQDTALTTTVKLQLRSKIAGLPVKLALAMDGPEAWQAEATIDVNQSLSEFVAKLFRQFVDPGASDGPFDAQTLPEIILKRITLRYSGKPEFFMISGELDRASLLFATYPGGPDSSAVNGDQDETPGKSRRYVLGFRWQPDLRLADITALAQIEVLSSLLDQLRLSQVGVFYTSQPFIDKLFPDDAGPTALGEGISFTTRLGTADAYTDLVIPPPPATNARKAAAPGTPKPESTSAVRRVSESQSPTRPKPPPNAGLRFWFKVQKNLGALQVRRVGVQWKDGKLGLLLDAGVDILGLTVGLTGFRVSAPFADFRPENLEFGLDGLNIAYRQGPIEISGAFLLDQSPPAEFAGPVFSGQAVIRAEKFTLAALGSYGMLQGGNPSLFVYAFYEGVPIGPACLQIQGIAAGFGYNRALKIPAVEDVVTFPLVALTRKPQPDKTVADLLADLSEHIPAAPGQYWLALGLKFTTFKIIDAFALLTVQFGVRLEFAVLGIATIQHPAGQSTLLVSVEMALKVRLAPDDGLFEARAVLTPNSYVFSKDCKLTGGAAFCLWFGRQHEGDFVFTLGGYHPKFLPPAHYPTVPRVGLNWQPSNEISIKGEAYFALTPAMIMAGGRLNAVFQSGDVRAWFEAYADFLIQWAPFYYDIAIGVIMGASYRLSVLDLSITLYMELGAQVHLWGPPFAGEAYISWNAIAFTVRFGNPSPPTREPITWAQFKTSFLPPAKDDPGRAAPVDIAISGGLLKDTKIYTLVNPSQLRLTIQSAIPSTTLLLNGAEIGKATTPLGIRPMAATTLNAAMNISLEKGGNLVAMRAQALTRGMPAALWSSQAAPQKLEKQALEQVIPDVPSGVEVSVSEPDVPLQPIPLSPKDLGYAIHGSDPRLQSPPALTSAPTYDETAAMRRCSASVMAPAVHTRRQAILETLVQQGFSVPEQGIHLEQLAATAPFLAPPILAGIGQLPQRQVS